MTIDKIKVQPTPPKSNCLMWAQPNGDTVDLKINVRGKWVPVGGSNGSIEEKIIVNIEDENVNYHEQKVLEAFALKKGFNNFEDFINYTNSLSEEERLELQHEYESFVSSSVSYTTNNHGTVIQHSPSMEYVLCEDGTLLQRIERLEASPVYYEIPKYMRYRVIMGTSSDSLAVRDLLTGGNVPYSQLHIVTDKIYAPSNRTPDNINVVFNIVEPEEPGRSANQHQTIWNSIVNVPVYNAGQQEGIKIRQYVMTVKWGDEEGIFIEGFDIKTITAADMPLE